MNQISSNLNPQSFTLARLGVRLDTRHALRLLRDFDIDDSGIMDVR